MGTISVKRVKLTVSQAAAHMVATLATDGTTLIPKFPINATMQSHIKTKSLWNTVAIGELEALGERHLGCGHDV